jgi:two-component system chemotaxis response regulator CheY
MAGTVLLVDDSKIIRTFIKVHLASRKFEYLEAGDGVEALTLARSSPVDLIIADINMPNMNGLDLVAALHGDSDPALRNIPVILLTGDDVAHHEERARAAGAVALLHKPVSSAGLVEMVARVLPPK